MMDSPQGLRTHIGIFGRTNAGKSTLINALTGQDVAIVSDVPGTTTDPVKKAMELSDLGPVLFIDTPGSGDGSELADERDRRTLDMMRRCDIAIIVATDEESLDQEGRRIAWFEKRGIPVVRVQTRTDETDLRLPGCIGVSCVSGDGLSELKQKLISCRSTMDSRSILAGMVEKGDVVLLVMPQDTSAPQGRLILPQVQTLRELLDTHCISLCIAPEEMEDTISHLNKPPKLIITDSQVFDDVYKKKPADSMLTSFSVLMAGVKGDIRAFVDGAKALMQLRDGSRVLVAESCTHAPKEEDIGRVKLPNLIRKKLGIEIDVTVYAGHDYPEDVSKYDIILQCGGCMNGRREMLSRIELAREAGVPITNYGIAIAALNRILDKVVIP
jgi:[FeFe] hydrogenase H-cluster maturation GTPase HydF